MILEPKKATLLNSATLILVGFISYIFSTSSTPLITVILGTLILTCYVLYDESPKLFAHIAILLMFLVFGGLFNPMMRAIGYSDPYAIIRVLVMQVVTVYSIFCFILSFVKARKKS
tara:strand:- start:170 stop:517 length:348 start_codon:yes stop_codon:yes gene_type:complete